MNLKKVMTLETLIALILIPLISSPVDAQILFSDDFETPAESENKWEVITGDWQFANGVYHQLSDADPWQASMIAADKWNDAWEEYTIEFNVKPLTAGDAPVNVLFRVREPVPQVWADRNGPNAHMYRWIVNGWTNTESRPYMYNAGTSVMLAQTNNSLVVGNWHHIKLVVTKTGFAGYVDDIEMFNIKDAEWTDGRIGIQAYSGMMEFDDFVVYGPGGRVFRNASLPYPPDKATDMPRDAILSWTPGAFAAAINGHRVNFSESFTDVNDGIGSIAQDANSFDPARLDFEQTYYWRVDEVNEAPDFTVFKGEIWRFTVEPIAIPIETVTATASGANPGMEASNTIDGSGLNDLDQHSSGSSDMWLTKTDGSWIQYEFDKAYKLHELLVWNSNQPIESFIGFGVKEAAIETSLDGVTWIRVEDAALFSQASGLDSYTANTTVDLNGIVAEYIKIIPQSAYGLTGQSGLSEVRILAIPTFARELSPADGSVTASVEVTLSWRAGREAASHEVYLGTDSTNLPLAGTMDESTFVADGLDYAQTYYWQVIEVNEIETPARYASEIQSFSTPAYGIVDDFESYSGQEGHEVFMTWLDGYGGNASLGGSTTGHIDGPFVETTIVKSGRQSMPIFYDNDGNFTNIDGNLSSPAFSEVVREFDSPQDWTIGSPTTLVLFFYGDMGNSGGQVYIKINNAKMGYNGNAAALSSPVWTQWNIDLGTAGTNLSHVNTLTIGVEGTGAGVLYVDDIRLYGQAPPI